MNWDRAVELVDRTKGKRPACPDCGGVLRVIGVEPAPRGADYVCDGHARPRYYRILTAHDVALRVRVGMEQ